MTKTAKRVGIWFDGLWQKRGPRGKAFVLASLGESERSGDDTNVDADEHEDDEEHVEDSERDMEGHLADYHFNEKSLTWMESPTVTR